MHLLLSLALADAPIEQAAPPDEAILQRNFHGFRVGYAFMPKAPEYSDRVRSPHMFVMGYEFTQRLAGGGWLNVIAVENFMLTGLNQSLVIPTFNGLMGFEMNQQVQLGVGINVNMFDVNEKYLHMIAAGGITVDAGLFKVPVHVYVIPDVDQDYRVGLTTGVNW